MTHLQRLNWREGGVRDIAAGAVRIGSPERGLGDGYGARPLGEGPFPGVVVVHHVSGLDEGTREIVRRVADHGYITVAPNLYSRDAPGVSLEESAVIGRAAGAPADDRVLGDVEDALWTIAQQPAWNGRAGLIGFCSGGRQAFVVAARTNVDAAVLCYGGRIVSRTAQVSEANPDVPIDLATTIRCPILGIFGAEDRNPSPDDVRELDEKLGAVGISHRMCTFEEAGHAFLDAFRDTFRPMPAMAAWKEIFGFLSVQLSVRT